jgi:hypothetical protein
VVAAFVQHIYEEQPYRYGRLVKIFLGILVEDFLSTVSELSEIDRRYPLVVFYDTTVLLRSLVVRADS